MTAIELIKSPDTTRALILFIKDDHAHRVIGAWEMMGIKCTDFPLRTYDGNFANVHEKLWRSAMVDIDALAFQADVPGSRCEKLFQRLKKANIIYPDGTISAPANNLIVSTAIYYTRKRKP